MNFEIKDRKYEKMIKLRAWHRWYAWYPVYFSTSRPKRRYIWLDYVERRRYYYCDIEDGLKFYELYREIGDHSDGELNNGWGKFWVRQIIINGLACLVAAVLWHFLVD